MAQERPLQGADLVREVFRRVRHGRNPIELFAPDALIVPAGRDPVVGHAAIHEFYAQTIAAIHPRPRVHVVLEAPPQFVAVVDVPTSAGRQRAVDLFTLQDERIVKLEIMSRLAIEGIDEFLS